jgi:hypothetical protein
MDLILNDHEIASLFRQDPSTRADGGFQSLMVGLQDNCDRSTGAISVTPQQADRIQKYAFNYGNGGWEDRLTKAFGRHLGPKLDGHDGT